MSTVLIGFAVLLFLIIVVRIPIAFAMGVVGFFGFAILQGLGLDNLASFRWTGALSMASTRVVDTVQDYGLSVIPLICFDLSNGCAMFVVTPPVKHVGSEHGQAVCDGGSY